MLTENYNGKALLLAEKVLTGGIPYYSHQYARIIGSQTVYPNNWQYSTIRAWLNGSYEGDDTQDTTYDGKGFLQTAFTSAAQNLIAATTVDNSAASTNPASNDKFWNSGKNEYASDTPTTDKIFLLSEKEATDSGYGFDTNNEFNSTRIRVTTDYAKATGANQNSTDGYGGWWWLRSPYWDDVSRARIINYNGLAINLIAVRNLNGGVVPALCIPANQLP